MLPTGNVFSLFLTKRGPQVAVMQELLRAIGEATSGTKDVLQTRLLTGILRDKMPRLHNKSSKKETRILSIDMGIRNLAYCVADVRNPTRDHPITEMHISDWTRLDLSEAFRDHFVGNTQEALLEEVPPEGQTDSELYTPENLSRMAYWFLDRLLRDARPDVILIERQRWRSASSPSIQQWTLRVNSLEAIMWAVLTTFKSAGAGNQVKFDGSIHAVDPKRVGHFWLDDVNPIQTPPENSKKKKKMPKSTLESEEIAEEDDEVSKTTTGTKKPSRSKAEKKAKIHLLQSWLDPDSLSTASFDKEKYPAYRLHPRIDFSFSPGSAADYATRQALLYATERPKGPGASKTDLKKVDDVTDCFLQAAAWVAWDLNLTNLKPQVDELREALEEKLGRKVRGSQLQLVEAVKELQKQAEEEVEDGGLKKTRAPRVRKKKATGCEGVDGEEEKTGTGKRKAKTKTT